MTRRRGEETCSVFFEVMAASRDINLGNDHRVSRHRGLQRNWIAAAWHAYRLRINRSSTVPANYAGRTLVEADRTADFTGVKNRGNFSVRLLIQPKTHVHTILLRLEGVNVSVVDLLQGDNGLAIGELHDRRGHRRADAFRVDELGGH